MKKYFRIALLVLFVALLVATFVFLWNKSRPKVDKFEVITPTTRTIEKKTIATGKVEPRDEVLIKPQISGIVSEVYKVAGEKVVAGEVIAKVKVIPEIGTLNAAQSRVALSKIAIEQAERDHKRVADLFAKGVVSREEYERSVAEYNRIKEEAQVSQDNLEIIQDGIAKRSAQYSNTQIRSTVSGMILDVPIKVGNSVIQSNNFNDGTTIASIADMSDMIFRGNIDETEVGRIHEGMPIKLSIGALQNVSFNAVLEYISPKGTEQNGAILFEMKAAVTIPDSIFVRAGYSANAEIILDSRTGVLSIPESTVEFSKDSVFVYLQTDTTLVSVFDRTPITVGLSDGIYIEVLSGLQSTEKIRGNKIIDKK